MGIIVVKSIETLPEKIVNYEQIIARIKAEIISNNRNFCIEFENIVGKMF